MTDQQKHFTNLLQQRQVLSQEIDSIQSQLNSKRELFLKVQGALEYLQQIGVTLPEDENSKSDSSAEETENN